MTRPELPHDELTAALEAQRELGPEYERAFVESLATRLEQAFEKGLTEVRAKQIDLERDKLGHRTAITITVPIVSLIAGIPCSAIGAMNAGMPGLLTVWIGIVLVNIAVMLRRT